MSASSTARDVRTWRPLTLICAVVLADLLVFGAVGVSAFPPAPVTVPAAVARATFTPNPAFALRFATPTGAPLAPLPTIAPLSPLLLEPGPGARRAHGRTAY